MSQIVAFDLRGPVAHYRRPDTLGTHASYPFIPRTALRGLIGAVLAVQRYEVLTKGS
jgi:CRISPR-associated protein Cas5h